MALVVRAGRTVRHEVAGAAGAPEWGPSLGRWSRLGAVTAPDEQKDRPLSLFRRLLGAGRTPVSPDTCDDLLRAPAEVTPTTPGRCEDHTPQDGAWVHLRVCLTCGHVGCCDSSRPRHASVHFERTGHPVMRSLEPGESWRWCFTHELLG